MSVSRDPGRSTGEYVFRSLGVSNRPVMAKGTTQSSRVSMRCETATRERQLSAVRKPFNYACCRDDRLVGLPTPRGLERPQPRIGKFQKLLGPFRAIHLL